MSTWISLEVSMVAETCWVCGTAFAISHGLHSKRMKDGARFYCPNGCHLCYGEGEVAKMERKLAQEKHLREQETARLRDAVAQSETERAHAEASLRATKGVVTRIKNRVAAGVCPCCNRTFQDLARHMKGQHPTWSGTE